MQSFSFLPPPSLLLFPTWDELDFISSAKNFPRRSILPTTEKEPAGVLCIQKTGRDPF